MTKFKQLLAVTCLIFIAITVAAVEHPHLLFSKSDLPMLKEKIKIGVPARAYKALLDRCNKYLHLQQLPTASYGIDSKCDPITELGIAYYLSGKKRYRNKFSKLLDNARKNKIDLTKLKYSVALIFDMGYAIMSDANLAWLKRILIKKARAYQKKVHPYWIRNSNWGTIVYMQGLLEALALEGEPEYNPALTARGAKELKNIFSNWIDDSGMPVEHGAYLDYGLIINGGLLSYIYKRKGFDIVTGTNLDKVPTWMMLASSPLTPMKWNAMGDCNLQAPATYAMRLLLCLLPDNELMNEVVRRCPDRYSPDPISGIFYYRKPVKSTKINCPNAKFFDRSNLIAYKSNFTPNAFSVVSQARWRQGHVHADVGSFVLWAYGIPWVIDSGYGKSDAGSHNLVMIDGKGPDKNGDSGKVYQCLISPFAIVFATSAKDTWNATRHGNLRKPSPSQVAFAERSLIIIPEDKQMEVPSYVLVNDFIQKDLNRHDYNWIMQIDKDAAFDNKNGHCVITVGKDKISRMDAVFLQPEELEIIGRKVVDYGRFKGRWHRRMNATFTKATWAKFLVMLYPRTAKMPEPKVKRTAKFGFNYELHWPHAIDYVMATEENEMSNGCELALVRIPKGAKLSSNIPEHSKYLMVKGEHLRIGNKDLVKISYKKRELKIRCSVSCSGGEMHIDVYADPEYSKQQLSMPVMVRAWGPDVGKVIFNGKEIAFERKGSYIEVRGGNRICQDNNQIESKKHQYFINNNSIK